MHLFAGFRASQVSAAADVQRGPGGKDATNLSEKWE